jgi:hypothetical protein
MAISCECMAYLLNRDWLFFQVPVSSSGAGAGAGAGALERSGSAMMVDRVFLKRRSVVWNRDHMKRHRLGRGVPLALAQKRSASLQLT